MVEAVTIRFPLHQSRCNNTTEVLRLHSAILYGYCWRFYLLICTYMPRDAYSVIVRLVVRPVGRAGLAYDSKHEALLVHIVCTVGPLEHARTVVSESHIIEHSSM